jgi:hypothetical protein
MTKEEIVSEIRRTAAENGGTPLGMAAFARETGIQRDDLLGVHWRTWSDAVREAGFHPNKLNPRIDDEKYLEKYALLTRELGRVPVQADLQMAKRRNPSIPSDDAFLRRFGSYAGLRSQVRDWCATQPSFGDVAALIGPTSQQPRTSVSKSEAPSSVGFVYMIRHGTRSEYKIGKTYNPIRREGELRLQLPDRVKPVHYIATDDPAGVEAYWHGRFAIKRMEGEWFALSAADVRAFKKWKKIS